MAKTTHHEEQVPLFTTPISMMELATAMTRVEEAKTFWKDAASVAQEAKKAYDTAVNELMSFQERVKETAVLERNARRASAEEDKPSTNGDGDAEGDWVPGEFIAIGATALTDDGYVYPCADTGN